jgi:hypothetical protein
MNIEPRTLSQRTIARRLREAHADRIDTPTPLPGVVLEAADEIDRLTARPDIHDAPVVDLFDELLELDHPTATAGAHELARLRQIIRDLFYDCESHQIPNRPGVRIVVPERLHDAIRNEARRP